jgi:ribosomal protein S18 acetylase RimI-like enzyme
MTISSRPYQSEADLHKIQSAVSEWIAIAGFMGYLNPSDIALRLFNGNRKYDPCEIVRLWEGRNGQIVGCGMVYPSWNSYEVLLHPIYHQPMLEMELLDWAQRELIREMQQIGREDKPIQLRVFDEDRARGALLEQRGYVRGAHIETISICSLDDPIPLSHLPAGFSIRSVQEEDADKLVALINDSFGLHWTVDGYREVMRSSGYKGLTELVVVAPDERFASSCILLPDSRNRTVMFENVGTHPEFRRMGLAKALLLAGMQRMKTMEFIAAMVPHSTGDIANPSDLTFTVDAATALYFSAGFRPTYKIYLYTHIATSR